EPPSPPTSSSLSLHDALPIYLFSQTTPGISTSIDSTSSITINAGSCMGSTWRLSRYSQTLSTCLGIYVGLSPSTVLTEVSTLYPCSFRESKTDRVILTNFISNCYFRTKVNNYVLPYISTR